MRHILADVIRREWRLLIPVVVTLSGTAAFMHISTTQHPEAFALREALYHSLSLFVLSPPGLPANGATGWHTLAWLTYFAAPLVTASALVEVARQIRAALKSPDRLASKMRNHYIICGYGKHGRLLLERILTEDPHADVLLIDKDTRLPSFPEGPHGQAVPLLKADLERDPASVLATARIDRAKSALAVTGNDLLNLSICIAAQHEQTNPEFRTLALVSERELATGFNELIHAQNTVLFNTYAMAAEQLLDHLTGEGTYTSPQHQGLVIMGFGRFGQMLAKAALEEWSEADRHPWIVVVDYEARLKVRRFRKRWDDDVPAVESLQGDIRDPAVVDDALSCIRRPGFSCDPLIALCTDDDTANLSTAMMLRRYIEDGKPIVLTRMFERPPQHVDSVLSSAEIRTFDLSQLIAEAVPDWVW